MAKRRSGRRSFSLVLSITHTYIQNHIGKCHRLSQFPLFLSLFSLVLARARRSTSSFAPPSAPLVPNALKLIVHACAMANSRQMNVIVRRLKRHTSATNRRCRRRRCNRHCRCRATFYLEVSAISKSSSSSNTTSSFRLNHFQTYSYTLVHSCSMEYSIR